MDSDSVWAGYRYSTRVDIYTCVQRIYEFFSTSYFTCVGVILFYTRRLVA